MRVIALFLLILFSCKPLAKPAWEIPYDEQKWSWFWFAAEEKNKDRAHHVEFTKLEKLPDGKVIYPYIVFDTKENKIVSGLEWVRADCQTKRAEAMGFFMNNTFSLAANPVNYPTGSMGYSSMLLYCGQESNQSGVIFGIGGYRANLDDWIYPVGVMHKNIKINSSDSALIDLILNIYTFGGGQIKNAIPYQANCKNNTLITSDVEILPMSGHKYALQFICDYAEKNLRTLNYKKENTNQIIPNKSAKSIDEAKDQCKTLGFKTGTEKFGTCVLELTK